MRRHGGRLVTGDTGTHSPQSCVRDDVGRVGELRKEGSRGLRSYHRQFEGVVRTMRRQPAGGEQRPLAAIPLSGGRPFDSAQGGQRSGEGTAWASTSRPDIQRRLRSGPRYVARQCTKGVGLATSGRRHKYWRDGEYLPRTDRCRVSSDPRARGLRGYVKSMTPVPTQRLG